MTIYGPITTYSNIGNPVSATVERTSYRQKPITKDPLPYHVVKVIAVSPDTAPSSLSGDTDVASRDKALYMAFRRFNAEIRESESALAADFAERKQSFDALQSRTLQLYSFTLHILARDYKGAARVLGLRKRRGGLRELSKDLSGTWLEYSFGWKPLIADIYSSVNVLQKPFVTPICRGRATVKQAGTDTIANPPYYHYRDYDRVYKAEVESEVSITNWPVWKANQLGLINPLSVAWEVVPFSFVVDWFVPVGEFLQSLTDYAGLQLQRSRYTQYDVWKRTDRWYFKTDVVKGVSVDRVLGLPSALGLLRPKFSGFYSARGANAIALLLGAMKGCRPK